MANTNAQSGLTLTPEPFAELARLPDGAQNFSAPRCANGI